VTRVAQDIPKIGLVMEDVKVVRWLKNVGERVTAGEPLLEVETEKSVVEIEAAVSGELAQILVEVDQQASVGDQVAWIESAEVVGASGTSPTPPSAVAPAAAVAATQTAPTPQAAAGKAASPVSGERLRITPVARKMAAERNINPATLSGTGPGGRIQLDDVQRAAAGTAKAPQPMPAGALPLTPMRRALARAMTLSNATVPQFNVVRSVDWTTLQALRQQYSRALPAGAPKLSVNDFLLLGVARVLLELPALNATFFGDADSPDACIVPASGAHIGLVVAVENGLLVPVIHDVDQLGLTAIAQRRQEGVERALQGRLKREESDGATFSISNLGSQGPDRFTAIINPPQSAILAVGRQRDVVVARAGAMVIRPQSELTLTVDHRVADGRLAAQFLARLVELLEGENWRR
jgi:pyruvate dehydrogenase E2 component (dihydrolipoamide acetyltransferase)